MATVEKTVTPTGAYPLTLEEVKAYLRIGNEVEDGVVERMIASATGWAEKYIGQSLVANEVVALFTNLTNAVDGNFEIELPMQPIDAVTQVDIAHADGTYTETEDFYTVGLTDIKVVVPAVVYSTKGFRGYKITYTTTANDASAIKDAILKMVSEMYNVRGMSVEGSVSEANQLSAMKLLHPFRTRIVW